MINDSDFLLLLLDNVAFHSFNLGFVCKFGGEGKERLEKNKGRSKWKK